MRAIEAMVAPVVLITSGVLVGNGLLATYTVVLEQIRVLKRMRLEGLRGELLHEIDRQLATLLFRVRKLHLTVLIIFGGTASLVLSVISIAVAEANRSGAFGLLAVSLILAGLVAILTGLVIVTFAYRTDWRLLMPLGRATVLLRPVRQAPRAACPSRPLSRLVPERQRAASRARRGYRCVPLPCAAHGVPGSTTNVP